jgi:PAS domain S-box-containing protein
MAIGLSTMQRGSQQQIRILHVDDDPAFTDLTGTFLERKDDRFAVGTAASADEGLEKLSDSPPDCVVSDYNMPGMDGLEFLRAVREEYPDLPFILFTGKGSEAVASEAIVADVTDYLQKGSGSEKYELLANRIRNAVQARRETKRAERQEQLMRLTEFAGGTGGFELDTETGDVSMTDGTRRILNLSGQANPNFETNLQHYHPDDRENIRQTVQRAIQTGDQTHGTWRYQHPDAENKLLDITYTPVPANGDTTTIRGAIHDITDRRERQQELRQLQQAIDNANVPITLADPSKEDDPLVYVNDGFEEMTGYPPEETLGRNCRFLQGEDTNPEKVATLREAIDNEETVSVELRNYRKDGTEFWNRLTLSPIYDDDGQLVRYLGTQQDITERKEHEQKLDLIETLFEHTEESQFIIDVADGEFELRYANQHYRQAVKPVINAPIIGQTPTELFGETAGQHVRERYRQCVETQDSITYTVELPVPKEGTVYQTILTPVVTDGAVTHIVGTARDITERIDRQQNLEEYKTIVEALADAVYMLNEEGQFTHVNDEFVELVGYDRKTIIGNTPSLIKDDDSVEKAEHQLGRLLSGDGPETVIFEVTIQPRTGDPIVCEDHMGVLPYEGEEFEGSVGVLRDITGREESKRKLQRITSQYEALVENFPGGGVFLLDKDMRFVRAGGDNLAEIGLTSADFEGNTPNDLYPDQTADEQVQYLKRTFDGESHTYRQEFQGAHYELRTMPIRDDTGEVIYAMAVSRDITQQVEQKHETQRQNERLEEFASIVSHDLQNPLGVAESYLELAQETGESEHITKARDAIKRSQTLITDLLTLARQGDQVDETDSVALANVADECWDTVETAAATLTVDATQSIKADRSRLKQLFENLYRNAVEHGGDDVTVSVGAMDDGFYVADTGPGIPESERADVFEAGYSTNEDGTGFGLRIIEQITNAHGWDISVVESDQGGARFEFTGVERVV